jgi:hypothetical protein
MDSIVFYTPLDGLGLVRLDLNACRRRIPLLRRDPFKFGKHAPMALNLTAEGRWVEAQIS